MKGIRDECRGSAWAAGEIRGNREVMKKAYGLGKRLASKP